LRKIQTSTSSQPLIFTIILINNLDCQGGSLALLVVVKFIHMNKKKPELGDGDKAGWWG
jgi:hypothetical protein